MYIVPLYICTSKIKILLCSWYNASEIHFTDYLLCCTYTSVQRAHYTSDVLVYMVYNHRVLRTRGRTGDAACTNATGPQGDKRAILYAR